MTQEGAIQRRLMELFKDKLELEVPSVETDLMASGLIDSLIFVELLFQIETEFGLTIAVDSLELEDFRSVVGIVGVIERLEQARGPIGSLRPNGCEQPLTA